MRNEIDDLPHPWIYVFIKLLHLIHIDVLFDVCDRPVVEVRENGIPVSTRGNGVGDYVALFYGPDVDVVAEFSALRDFLPDFFVWDDGSVSGVVGSRAGLHVRKEGFADDGAKAVGADEEVESMLISLLCGDVDGGRGVLDLRDASAGDDADAVTAGCLGQAGVEVVAVDDPPLA